MILDKSHKLTREAVYNLLQEEQKIVTFKWLKRNYHLNNFQINEFLKEFCEASAFENIPIYITYRVYASNKKNPESFSINLLNSSQLGDFDQEYNVLSKNIYAISNSEIKDFNLIYLVDYEQSKLIDDTYIKSNLIRDPSIKPVSNISLNTTNELGVLPKNESQNIVKQLKRSPDKLPIKPHDAKEPIIDSSPISSPLRKKGGSKIKLEDKLSDTSFHKLEHKSSNTNVKIEVKNDKPINDDEKGDTLSTLDNDEEPMPSSHRKLINKTYLNEEGFLVTEKVWESTSQINTQSSQTFAKATKSPIKAKIEKQTKEEKVKKEQQKSLPTKKGQASKPAIKQASMTDFFKKK